MLNLGGRTPSIAAGASGAACSRPASRELRLRGGREVFLEVRESNAAAQALYCGRGFRVVGARQRYYRHPVEDALVLRLPLPDLCVNLATTDVDLVSDGSTALPLASRRPPVLPPSRPEMWRFP